MKDLQEALARLPTVRDEDWRYTDLRAVAARAYVPAAPAQPHLPSLAGVERIAYINGLRNKPGTDPDFRHEKPGTDPDFQAKKTGSVPDYPDAVAALNAAFATAGLDLAVPADTARAPLHVVTWFGGTANGTAHLRHRVRLARGASAVLVLHELGDDAPFFATQTFDVELAEGSRLAVYRIQQLGRGTSALTRVDVRVGRDARFAAVGVHGGGALVRNDVNVSLAAPGADVALHGVLLPATGEHLDVHTRLDHRAPHGRSRESFRCIVPGKARAVFNGKVIVHRDAQKTDSEQHVDSLLLAPGAEVDAKPELQIDADDVKCAHGATCGQLDDEAVFYLRSRGLDLATARRLLLHTFAHEVLQHIAFEPARRLAGQLLEARL